VVSEVQHKELNINEDSNETMNEDKKGSRLKVKFLDSERSSISIDWHWCRSEPCQRTHSSETQCLLYSRWLFVIDWHQWSKDCASWHLWECWDSNWSDKSIAILANHRESESAHDS